MLSRVTQRLSSSARSSALPTISVRTNVFGPPPVQIGDLIHLYYGTESWPTKDREPADMLAADLKRYEVVGYMSGRRWEPNDEVNEAFSQYIQEAKVLFFTRNAADKPEFFKHLQSQGGKELPQLWVYGKLVGQGAELADRETVERLTAPARRPWPRDNSYYNDGFIGSEGLPAK